MKLGLVIASHGRPHILKEVLWSLASQFRIPDYTVLSAVVPEDIPDLRPSNIDVQLIFGDAGSSCQRNRGIAELVEKTDVIIFIDDDFIVGDNYFLNIETIFAQDSSIVGLNGMVIADGASTTGFTFDEGLQLLRQYNREKVPNFIRDVKAMYGCNMAFRTAGIGAVRFDERLPLYGWQEDLDFCGALNGRGRIVLTNHIWGVHLGTKLGKGSEVRLGYSQMVNPAYIARKGNMSPWFAFRLAFRNLLANLIKSIRPESYVDRRGRLRGNLIGILHLMKGQMTPEYILKLK
jgi:GT2 family glycosyltransferase